MGCSFHPYMMVVHEVTNESVQTAYVGPGTPAFKMLYDARVGVRGCSPRVIRIRDLRHARDMELAKPHLRQVPTAAAPNKPTQQLVDTYMHPGREIAIKDMGWVQPR